MLGGENAEQHQGYEAQSDGCREPRDGERLAGKHHAGTPAHQEPAGFGTILDNHGEQHAMTEMDDLARIAFRGPVDGPQPGGGE